MYQNLKIKTFFHDGKHFTPKGILVLSFIINPIVGFFMAMYNDNKMNLRLYKISVALLVYLLILLIILPWLSFFVIALVNLTFAIFLAERTSKQLGTEEKFKIEVVMATRRFIQVMSIIAILLLFWLVIDIIKSIWG